MNLYLDDLRPAPEGFVLARTVEEAIRYFDLNLYPPVINLSLDHDLGGEDGSYTRTGYDFVCWLENEWTYGNINVVFPRRIFLHTGNPVGRDNMLRALNRCKPVWCEVHNSPIPWEREGLL